MMSSAGEGVCAEINIRKNSYLNFDSCRFVKCKERVLFLVVIVRVPKMLVFILKLCRCSKKGGVRCGMRSVGEFQRKNLGWLGGEIAQEKRGE